MPTGGWQHAVGQRLSRASKNQYCRRLFFERSARTNSGHRLLLIVKSGGDQDRIGGDRGRADDGGLAARSVSRFVRRQSIASPQTTRFAGRKPPRGLVIAQTRSVD